ncbi:MAG: carboxypeptidase regulatory-like domain-containing protein [Chitinophagaceae bacterium]|nr:carboxypeptidase regulatory-like domain-containing protein [Chitinophagaceae bacterium]
MKHIAVIIISLIFLADCSKRGIEAEKLYVRGRLFLLDTVTRTSKGIPLSHRGVTLARGTTDSLNFLYSDTTDDNGYFVFTILVDDQKESFTVRFEDTIGGYYYKGSAKAPVSSDTVVLIATLDTTKQNGFIIRLVDEQGQPLPAATFRIYNNEALALRNDSTGAGLVQTSPVDVYGRVYKFNLPEGNYYLNAEKKVDTLVYQRLAKKIYTHTLGFFNDTMVLPRKVAADTNGFVITVEDSLGGAIPAASVNLYTSKLLALSNDPTGAIESFTSDTRGVIKKKNLPSGNYYLSARKSADTVTYLRLARPIIVPPRGLLTDTLTLLKK